MCKDVERWYLVVTKSHQRCRNVESSLRSDVPVSAEIESVDEHHALLPALPNINNNNNHHHHQQQLVVSVVGIVADNGTE